QSDKKFGDKCNYNSECGFDGSYCDDITKKCLCKPEVPVTNHLDKCGIDVISFAAVKVNESCSFNEQCEFVNYQTECKDGVCSCRFEKQAIIKPDGQIDCVTDSQAALHALKSLRITSQVVLECTNSLAELGQRNKVRLVWVPGHSGVAGNEEADVLVLNRHKHFGAGYLASEDIRVIPVDKIALAALVAFPYSIGLFQLPSSGKHNRPSGLSAARSKLAPQNERKKKKVMTVGTKTTYTPERYVDPAMIGILVAMFLMFITICIVLRLFSKARWRENRTIFNTPNPRLMNASLLKENKHLHDRRESKISKGPSRQPSIVSLRPQSPNSQAQKHKCIPTTGRLFLGSRRGSRGSSIVSVASTKSNKNASQTPNMNSATTPMLESVTVEIQEPKI
ncbi:hypothetical protein NQ315_002817, partial [Exocentrus adspersus]